MHRILMIDDDRELVELIQEMAAAQQCDIKSAFDGHSGIAMLEQEASNIDLVVLDVMLPDINGFEVLTQIRNISPVPVLMLTARDSEEDKIEGLSGGADDYLTKPFSLRELFARMHSQVRRYRSLGSSENQKALVFQKLAIFPEERRVEVDSIPVKLTAKEFDMLYFLASHPGQIFTKKQLYNQLNHDEAAFDASNFVAFISKLRKKIEIDSAHPHYIETVRGIGYRFAREG